MRNSARQRRWHRRLGLSAAAFLLLFAASGVLLQHTSWLGLDQSYLPAGLTQALYEVSANTITTYRLPGHSISHVASSIYIDGSHVPKLRRGQLRGAMEYQGLLWIAADGELLLLSPRGELLDNFSVESGLLPEEVTRLGTANGTGGTPIIAGRYQRWLLEQESLDWAPYHETDVAWSEAAAPGALAPEVRDTLLADANGRLISWERLLLDLHSGRLFGPVGVVAADLAALLTLLLVVTGAALWLRQH